MVRKRVAIPAGLQFPTDYDMISNSYKIGARYDRVLNRFSRLWFCLMNRHVPRTFFEV